MKCSIHMMKRKDGITKKYSSTMSRTMRKMDMPMRNYGVNARRGCLVVVRPDQYAGWIGELEDVKDMERYFDGILMEF